MIPLRVRFLNFSLDAVASWIFSFLPCFAEFAEGKYMPYSIFWQDHIDFLLGKTFLVDLNSASQITQQFLYCNSSVSNMKICCTKLVIFRETHFSIE